MSHVHTALNTIKLAAQEPGVGGIGDIATRAGVSIDTGRRLVKTPPKAIVNLQKMEEEAAKILGDRAP